METHDTLGPQMTTVLSPVAGVTAGAWLRV